MAYEVFHSAIHAQICMHYMNIDTAIHALPPLRVPHAPPCSTLIGI